MSIFDLKFIDANGCLSLFLLGAQSSYNRQYLFGFVIKKRMYPNSLMVTSNSWFSRPHNLFSSVYDNDGRREHIKVDFLEVRKELQNKTKNGNGFNFGFPHSVEKIFCSKVSTLFFVAIPSQQSIDLPQCDYLTIWSLCLFIFCHW